MSASCPIDFSVFLAFSVYDMGYLVPLHFPSFFHLHLPPNPCHPYRHVSITDILFCNHICPLCFAYSLILKTESQVLIIYPEFVTKIT